MKIESAKDSTLTELSNRLLTKHYLIAEETSPQQAYARAATCYSAGDSAFAQRIYNYVSDGWFMFSSPALSNAVYPDQKIKGMPIACFVTDVDDSIKGLNNHTAEYRNLSIIGGGVGGAWTKVRGMNEITPGPVGFLHSVDADMTAYKQGATRRGSYASYMDVTHPDIMDFIRMRIPSGDMNRKNLNLHHGVNITDEFMLAVENDFPWVLLNPHNNQAVGSVKARELWELILETRARTGEPYINHVQEANAKLHPALKEQGLRITGSNLCNEIHLPSSKDRTAVCCLSSVNLAKYDEWKGTNMVADLIRLLDNILQFFIDNGKEDEVGNAIASAKAERSLGLGAMGFHDYLQLHNIEWESSLAISYNRAMFALIKKQALQATQDLAKERGEALDAVGHGVRNTHLLAIAPNANSSLILDASPSIEPRFSNAITQKTRVGSFLVKNMYLEKLLEKKGMNTPHVWDDIIANDGSVQHLDFLTEHEKNVFKTSLELDQRWVVDQARARQEYICQGQSVNLAFRPGADRGYVNMVHRRAFDRSLPFDILKGVYYYRTLAATKTENVAFKVERDALADGIQGATTCLSCEG